jgi:acetyl esterase/lipase
MIEGKRPTGIAVTGIEFCVLYLMYLNNISMKQIITIILLFTSIAAKCQNKELIYLWPGNVPGETREKQKPVIDTTNKDKVIRITEITNPAIEVWLPDTDKNNGSGVIICPGGAYVRLSYNKEGTEIAEWLNKMGCAAFVLTYRVPNKIGGALQDAQRALRVVRSNAARWKLDPKEIGIMGFSAGGSLSARSATEFNVRTYSPVDKADSLSCRPAFALLIYPAYLDQGENKTLTPELTISQDTPPMFIFQTADDTYGNSSLVMASALRNAKSPVELHVYQKGGHGYGLRSGNPAAEIWPSLAGKWLLETLENIRP